MLQKIFSFSGMLVLAGAAILWTAGQAEARGGGGGGHGGGGHAGGGHGGGFGGGGGHYGGYHGGGYHGGGYHGGYHYGGYHHGGYGGYRPYSGYHHHYYYPYFGSYPYYGYYPYYDNYSYDYDSTLGGTGVPPVAENASPYVVPAASPAPADNTIRLTVNVPANAEIWVDRAKTTSTGPLREFKSPPVTPGERYTYEIRARWNENGHEVSQTQTVGVTAGAHVNVSFPAASGTAEQKTAGG